MLILVMVLPFDGNTLVILFACGFFGSIALVVCIITCTESKPSHVEGEGEGEIECETIEGA
jgi:hypothetical protein